MYTEGAVTTILKWKAYNDGTVYELFTQHLWLALYKQLAAWAVNQL